MANQTSLFVYGSFCQGMVHFQKIEKYIVNSQVAYARGSVFRLPVGYPVFVNKGHALVPGQLVTIEAPELLITLLDEFHGVSQLKPEKSLFFKEQIQVQTAASTPGLSTDGEHHDTFVYALNPLKLPRQAEEIEGGDWVSDLKNRPVLTSNLTDRQKAYIKKLGSSTGRDIVPIDLDLYRELLKLDLIVDKGRRLALTKLGKEAYRYLY